ncbi:MAG TPA: CDP-alcohol phosphatidyltransferase family protein [Xanthobacteraceae bacterium]|nr:CDP-alcohol phosphatidyltransferase family protein [Xanthobacteraceae bacterium]
MSSNRPADFDRDSEIAASAGQRAAAFAVHIFTALGAGLAFLALVSAVRANWTSMFWILGLALIVDAVDGSLARAVNVAGKLPRWSGDSLDFVVDFTTYVFVPAYAIAGSGLLPPTAAVPLGALIVVAGALYFADRRMKTSDNYFRGFPVLWNVAAFYLFLIKPAPWIAAIGIILLVALTFVPFHFIHPVRVRRWRVANVSLMVIWSGLAAWTVAKALDPPAWITLGLCGIAIYFIAAGLLRSAEGNGMPDA